MPDYRTGQAARGTRPFSAVSGMLNLKRQFEDAKRQNEWKMRQDYMNNQSDMQRQRTSTAGQLLASGHMTADQFRSNTASTDPYSGQEVPGMEVSNNTERKLSPAVQNAKDKRTQEVMTSLEDFSVQRQTITDAAEAAKKISGGIYGKVSRSTMKHLAPNSPILGEWQKVKMALTDAQLMQSLLLKGHISDVENAWLATAAANDDVAALPRITPVLNRALNSLNAKEKGLVSSYKKIYGEDPYSWGNYGEQSGSSESGQTQQPNQVGKYSYE